MPSAGRGGIVASAAAAQNGRTAPGEERERARARTRGAPCRFGIPARRRTGRPDGAFATVSHPITPYLGLCEPVCALSHLLGGAAALAAAGGLLRLAGGDARRRLVLGALVATIALQLVVSGLYHAYPHGTPERLVLQRLDHAAIWLLVAGCFLPVQQLLLRGRFGRALGAAVGLGALAGALGQTAFFAAIPDWASVLLYVGFGSIGTPVALWLVVTRGLRFTAWFFAFGVLVSSAALLELAEVPTLWPGVIQYHEVVHLVVLAALACHWRFVAGLAARELPAPDTALEGAAEAAPALPIALASGRLPGAA